MELRYETLKAEAEDWRKRADSVWKVLEGDASVPSGLLRVRSGILKNIGVYGSADLGLPNSVKRSALQPW